MIPYNGKDNLKYYLPEIVTYENFSTAKSLGITRDSDVSQKDTLRSVIGSLEAASIRADKPFNKIPDKHNDPVGSDPKVGIISSSRK